MGPPGDRALCGDQRAIEIAKGANPMDRIKMFAQTCLSILVWQHVRMEGVLVQAPSIDLTRLPLNLARSSSSIP